MGSREAQSTVGLCQAGHKCGRLNINSTLEQSLGARYSTYFTGLVPGLCLDPSRKVDELPVEERGRQIYNFQEPV